MAKEYKMEQIRQAYEEFANKHKGQTMTAKEINDGVQKMLDFDTKNDLVVSDFAEPETLYNRSEKNKTLFKRIENGVYFVIGS